MKKSLYQNFFQCFLLVMLLPTVILSITLVFFNGYILKQNTKALSTHTFSVLEKEFNYYIKQLGGSKRTLTTDISLMNASLETDPYVKFQLIRKLNSTKDILGFCSDIGTFNIKNKKVISSGGESTLSVFFDSSEPARDVELFSSMENSYLLYPYETKTSTRFLYLCKLNYIPDTFLFFTFDSYHFYNTISDLLKDSHGTVVLENSSSGDLFFLGDTICPTQEEKFTRIITDFPATASHITLASTFADRYQLPAYKLAIYVFIPATAMQHSLITILFISAGILLFSFCSGLFLVRYMASANYTPIRDIKYLIPQDHLSDTENELTLINQAILHMNEEISDLNKKLNTNRENIKKSILIRLLYHQYPSEKDFLEDAKIINIQQLYPFFTICILHYEADADALELYEYLNRREYSDCQCFLLNSLETARIILIYNFIDNSCDFKAFIKKLSQDIFLSSGKNITIGVSPEHHPFEQIPKLYELASEALNYSFVTGKYTITFSPQTYAVKYDYSSVLPQIDYDELEKCILECNDALLIRLFYEVFEKIQKSGYNLNSIKIYLFDMMIHIRSMLFKLDITDYRIIDEELSAVFMNSETIEELFNSLYTIMVEIGKNLHMVSDEEKIELIQKYIYDHLCDIDFNVNSISDHFHISLPTLSRFYKQKQNQNISAFINELKIEKTKELLIKTDRSIEYIVEELGYSNTSSFIRKFKASVGMTPGQFRQQNKNSSL